MGLVDYGSSGESGDEDNESEIIKKVECKPSVSKQEQRPADVDLNECNVSAGEIQLFSSLPKPKGKVTLDGSEDNMKKLLQKTQVKGDGTTQKEHVKIMIPSLSEFANDEAIQSVNKKVKPATKGTGLFSVLPPPKNTAVKESNRPLIPHAVKNKVTKPISASVNTTVSNKSQTNSYIGSTDSNKDEGEDENNDEPISGSYFGDGVADCSANSVNLSDNSNLMLPSHSEQGDAMSNIEYKIPQEYDIPLPDYGVSGHVNTERVVSGKSDVLELDEKALHILCGGKRKRTQMPVNIIDLSSEQIMPDSKEWLLKQFTEEKKVRHHSHKKHEGPSVQQRRKHQITYLAFQAKEQELELQNQWSNNRMSRRQTQSKYGF